MGLIIICSLTIDTVSTPEIAFTGDTTSDFIIDPGNADVLRAKVLVVEVFCYHVYCCFIYS
jgi:hypothetical protein